MCTECHSTSSVMKDVVAEEAVMQVLALKELMKEMKEEVSSLRV